MITDGDIYPTEEQLINSESKHLSNSEVFNRLFQHDLFILCKRIEEAVSKSGQESCIYINVHVLDEKYLTEIEKIHPYWNFKFIKVGYDVYALKKIECMDSYDAYGVAYINPLQSILVIEFRNK